MSYLRSSSLFGESPLICNIMGHCFEVFSIGKGEARIFSRLYTETYRNNLHSGPITYKIRSITTACDRFRGFEVQESSSPNFLFPIRPKYLLISRRDAKTGSVRLAPKPRRVSLCEGSMATCDRPNPSPPDPKGDGCSASVMHSSCS